MTDGKDNKGARDEKMSAETDNETFDRLDATEEEGRQTYAPIADDDEVLTTRIATPEEVKKASHEHGDGGHDDGHGHEEHGGHGHGGGRDAVLRQVSIVVLLVVAMIVLHWVAVPVPESDDGHNYDPTAMLALGFVVLACFTIGALVDVVKLPHITGYLLAGMAFGPSIIEMIPFSMWAPFDKGVLNEQVIAQLSPLNTLAVALIALTAGGELRVEQLRQGLRAIGGVLTVQLVTVLSFSTAFFWAVSGAIPAITLPGLGDVSAAWLPIGLTVGAISFATSPAATVAIINETGAKGPMTRTVMSSVVLKDVVVVVLFGVFSAIAGQSMGVSSEGSIVVRLSIEIGGSIVGGVALGGLMALYLRFVGRELLLFVAGIIYLTTLFATALHLDSVLVFLTAGFVVANYSKHGSELIHSVEKLSMPVYVVFFTLAGANLHIDQVIDLIAFAVALVAVRVAAIYIGVRIGAIVGGADDGTRRYGWMGFLSQAGVAITFAGFLGDPERFPPEVHALSSLLIAGVAINEVLGPVLLKVSLSLAGETGDSKQQTHDEIVQHGPTQFAEWPSHIEEVDWGDMPVGASPAVERALEELEGDLREIVKDVDLGPMRRFERSAETYLRSLRREFLRHHRRLLVQARSVSQAEDAAAAAKAREELAASLHTEQAELAERWRSTVLTRAAQLRKKAHWHPADLIEALDAVSATIPKSAAMQYTEQNYKARPTDPVWLAVRRAGRRIARRTGTLIGRPMPKRMVPLQELVRYHLAGETPPHLESTAALLVDAERHLAGRTRHLFDGIVAAYDALAAAASDPYVDIEARVAALREDMEDGLLLALDEVQRMGRGGTSRTARTLARGLRHIKDDLPEVGTFDLPIRRRQSSTVFRERVRAMELLSETVDELRDSCGGEFSLLAMELEIVGLEARLKDVVAGEQGRLERELEGRAVGQMRRADEALAESLEQVALRLRSDDSITGEVLATELRSLTESAEKVAGDASRIVREMRDGLLDETKFDGLIKELRRTAETLTTRYDVIAGRMMRGDDRLPTPVPSVEVPLRELVSEYTETTVMPKLYRAARTAADELQPLTLALKEAERLIAFNVELATAELDVVHDDPVPHGTRELLHEMIFGQLDRVHATIRSLAQTSVEWPQVFGSEVRSAVLGALDELRGQLADGKITQAKLNVIRKTATRRRLAQQASDLPKQFTETWQQIQESFVTLIGAERLAGFRDLLGLPQSENLVSFQSDAFAEPENDATLPVVYRRLFAADTMEASDVLTGRDALIRQAREILSPKTKKRGRCRAVALVGPDGVGKASVGGAIVRGGRWKSVARIHMEGPQSVTDVQEALAKASRAQLVVVEGLHWLISAKPGGFAPLRAFIDGMLDDGDERSWLVHADELLWRYASAIAPIEDAFPEVIHLRPLTVEELTSAVMERHRLSGYGHAFERIETGSRAESLLVRAVSKVRSPYELYFAELHAATGGLVRDALRLWLTSIRHIEADDIVHVGPVPPSGYHAVRALPDDDLHTLFLVARQGWMDAEALASLRRRDERSSRAELARLEHLGVLCGTDGTLRIASHLRGVVGRVLGERGWS